MKATRSTRRLLTWLCITASVVLVVQTNAALVLCVANDHTAVEAARTGSPSATPSLSLGEVCDRRRGEQRHALQ